MALKLSRNAWPRHMVIEELFNNDNGAHNHVHVASRNRRALKRIGNIAQRQYSGGDTACVREFPPFDLVEDVHTSGSWHYRDHRDPDTPRDYSNRGDGLAFDLRSARRQAFADEVKRRYGAKECDF